MRSTLTLVTKKPKEIPIKPVQSSVQVRNKIESLEHQVDKFTLNLGKKAHNSVLLEKSSQMQKQSEHSVYQMTKILNDIRSASKKEYQWEAPVSPPKKPVAERVYGRVLSRKSSEQPETTGHRASSSLSQSKRLGD